MYVINFFVAMDHERASIAFDVAECSEDHKNLIAQSGGTVLAMPQTKRKLIDQMMLRLRSAQREA